MILGNQEWLRRNKVCFCNNLCTVNTFIIIYPIMLHYMKNMMNKKCLFNPLMVYRNYNKNLTLALMFLTLCT